MGKKRTAKKVSEETEETSNKKIALDFRDSSKTVNDLLFSDDEKSTAFSSGIVEAATLIDSDEYEEGDQLEEEDDQLEDQLEEEDFRLADSDFEEEDDNLSVDLTYTIKPEFSAFLEDHVKLELTRDIEFERMIVDFCNTRRHLLANINVHQNSSPRTEWPWVNWDRVIGNIVALMIEKHKKLSLEMEMKMLGDDSTLLGANSLGAKLYTFRISNKLFLSKIKALKRSMVTKISRMWVAINANKHGVLLNPITFNGLDEPLFKLLQNLHNNI